MKRVHPKIDPKLTVIFLFMIYGVSIWWITETQSLTAGTFKNSDFEQSRYLGWYWLPLALGPVRFGGTFGIMDGYSKARNGKFFPAILPAISYERSRLGVNIYPIPGFSDNLYTAISIQVKIRLDWKHLRLLKLPKQRSQLGVRFIRINYYQNCFTIQTSRCLTAKKGHS